jgi:hypothetical protein
LQETFIPKSVKTEPMYSERLLVGAVECNFLFTI